MAAKQMRAELKKAFPETTFSVKAQGYAGGDSINVRYTNGPALSEVEKITSKYQMGSYNGMEDIYEYNNRVDGIEQVKYVFTYRKEAEVELPEEKKSNVIANIAPKEEKKKAPKTVKKTVQATVEAFTEIKASKKKRLYTFMVKNIKSGIVSKRYLYAMKSEDNKITMIDKLERPWNYDAKQKKLISDRAEYQVTGTK